MKIGLLLDSEHAIRAWVDSKNINRLSSYDKITTVVYLSENIQQHELVKDLFKINNIKMEKISIKKTPRFFDTLFFALLVHNKEKSKSFKARINRLMYGFCMDKNSKINKISSYLIGYKQLIIYIPILNLLLDKCAKILFMSWNPLQNHHKISALNYMILSTSTFEFHHQSFINLMRKKRIKTIMCVDNWDNISSKTILKILPDFMTVLGPQSKRHAYQIQNMASDKVFDIGTPRFDEYRNNKSNSNVTRAKKNPTINILYLGSALPHAERSLIYQLVEIHKTIGQKNKIQFHYKPHPDAFPRCRDLTDMQLEAIGVEILGSRSQIDTETKQAFKFEKMGGRFRQMFNDYDIIISTPTTAALESMLCRRPTIIDATNDGIHVSTAALSLVNYEHFKEFKELSNLVFAKSIDELYTEITNIISKKELIRDYELSDIVHLDNMFFVDRLLNSILSNVK